MVVQQQPDGETQRPAWSICPQFRVSESSLVHARSGGPSDEKGHIAVGNPVVSSGIRVLSLALTPTRAGGGGDVYLGVCDASAPLNEDAAGKGWGVRVRTCECHVTPNGHFPGYRGRSLLGPHAAARSSTSTLMALTLVVRIDMLRRTLAFSIDGGPLVEAAVQLPAAIRPWVLCIGRRKGDTVELSDASAEGLPTLPTLSVPLPPPPARTRATMPSPRIASYVSTQEAFQRETARKLLDAAEPESKGHPPISGSAHGATRGGRVRLSSRVQNELSPMLARTPAPPDYPLPHGSYIHQVRHLPMISPDLPMISPHLPTSPHISRDLLISHEISPYHLPISPHPRPSRPLSPPPRVRTWYPLPAPADVLASDGLASDGLAFFACAPPACRPATGSSCRAARADSRRALPVAAP